MTDAATITEVCEDFLADWDRDAYVVEHAQEWASERYDEARKEYDDAHAAVYAALDSADDAELVDAADASNLEERMGDLLSAIRALEGQISAGSDADYVVDRRTDPDCVADDATPLGVGRRWSGWDCTEGWDAYRAGTALYLRWWRDAYGQRHDRDIWVCIGEEMFAADADSR